MRKLFSTIIFCFLALASHCSTAHTVSLSWGASSTSTVTKYNIYRTTTSGVYSATPYGTVAAPTLTFTDQTVTNGTTYCYEVTAADSLGDESVKSNEVCGTIPTDPNAPAGLILVIR